MRLTFLILLLCSACGYAMGTGRFPQQVERIAVPPVTEDGVDVDAAGVLAGLVRKAVAAHPAARLVSAKRAEAILHVKLDSVGGGLAPLSDPGSRAAQYRSQITITAQLKRPGGEVIWRSGRIVGQADFLSVPDAIETLDGARRRALARAAENATDQLMTSLIYRR
jgi:hypothetical protein